MSRALGARGLLVVGTVAALLSAGPAAAQQRAVDLTAPDSVRLKATLFPASAPGPGVLLLHQCNRQRTSWDGLGQRLASAGFHVLALDLRGFGESGGDRFAQLPPGTQAKVQALWPGDIDVAFRHLVSQPGVRRDAIGVAGASCGVNNAVQAARRHPEVKSLVLLSGHTNLEGRRFLRSGRRVPAFLALADDDEFPQSVVTTQWLYSLTASPEKRLVRYATGGHGADVFAPHPELMDAIVDWFRATLTTSGGRVPADSTAVAREAETIALIDEPGGAAKVSQRLAEARRRDPNATLFPEAVVNIMGYDYLQAGDAAEAIEIFALNVSAFPNSPNAYDSLADAYLAGGQKDLARSNAQKALDLLPSAKDVPEAFRNAIRESAEQKLKQLGGSQR
jgi:dienelactone hydrolase